MRYQKHGQEIVEIIGKEQWINNVHQAVEWAMQIRSETDCSKIIVPKACFPEPFFVLSTGIAGEILQKFVTYQIKIAIVGDFSKYTSKPLQDFIYESNKGKEVFFVNTVEAAVEKLRQSN